MITIFNRQKLIECNTEEIRMKAGQCLKNNNIEYKVKYKIYIKNNRSHHIR